MEKLSTHNLEIQNNTYGGNITSYINLVKRLKEHIIIQV